LFFVFIIIIIIINDSIYPAVSKASRTGNKVSCKFYLCCDDGLKLILTGDVIH